MPAKSLELKHIIKLPQKLTAKINKIETDIKQIMDEEIQSPILTIPGISYRMRVMILAEIGDFSRFDSADKILAYAEISPFTYQSGQLDTFYAHMEKRVHDTFSMPFTTLQSMSATGMKPLEHTLRRNVLKKNIILKENIIMSLYLTQRRNLCGQFSQWKNQGRHTYRKHNLFCKYLLLECQK